MSFEETVTYPADRAVVSSARSWACAHLAEHLPAAATGSLLFDVRLVVSELVTNAVRCGSSEVAVRLRVGADTVLIGVRDSGAGTPVLTDAAVTDTHGRGLAIVAALADDWGVTSRGGGHKEVWARLGVPPP